MYDYNDFVNHKLIKKHFHQHCEPKFRFLLGFVRLVKLHNHIRSAIESFAEKTKTKLLKSSLAGQIFIEIIFCLPFF